MIICDATSNTVLWQSKITLGRMGVRLGIVAFSFSPDKSRLLSANREGQVSIWDVSALLHDHTHSTVEDPITQNQLDDSRAPRFLGKFNVKTPSRYLDRIAFSTDNRAVVTYEGYAPIPFHEHWPLSAQREDASQPKQGGPAVLSEFPNYYVVFDGWIWRVDPGGGRRRVRWVPPSYRYNPSNSLGGWDIRGNRIALVAGDGRLVIVDPSDN